MTESRIDQLLDECVPAFETRSEGWEDVLSRAHRGRRHYVAPAVVALALLLVPTAVALRGQIADLFQGTPAPPAISNHFAAQNRMADEFTQKSFGDKFPHADVSQAHGVIEIQTADGPQDLWSAPSDMGGTCYFIDWANDAPEPQGQQYGFGGCDRSAPPASGIGWGSVWVYAHPNLLTAYGQVYVPAARVHVELADGTVVTLPVVEGYFLGSLPNGVKVEQITAYNDSGDVVATSERTG
jgi:hypothetical protein